MNLAGSASLIHRGRLPSNDGLTLFFGDSFVRMFGLIDHPDLKVVGFKGASAKGLTREANENRLTMLRRIQQSKPDRVVLCFGSVDVHLSYYFTKYVKDDSPTIDLKAVADAYVDFAASLPVKNIHVIGVYPSPLAPHNVRQSLMNYGIIQQDTILSEEDLAVEGRQNRVREFNESLKAACLRHGLSFESIYDDVLDPDTNLLKPCFQDVAECNVHIVWETTILVWLDRLPWLRALAGSSLLKSLNQSLKKYLRSKPWANQGHAANYVNGDGIVDATKGHDGQRRRG